MDPFKPYQPKARAAAPPKLSVEDAAAVALRALAFIAGNDALLSAFVALTGCGLDDIKTRMAENSFLGAVLDFLLGDEAQLMAFVEAEGLHPETPMLARHRLG